ANVEVVVLQPCPKGALHLDLVFDDKDATAHRLTAKRASGRVKVNRGPRRRFSARITPPCASTTRLTMARPRPVPAGRRVQNVSKTRSRSAGAMGGPSFSTHASTWSSMATAP